MFNVGEQVEVLEQVTGHWWIVSHMIVSDLLIGYLNNPLFLLKVCGYACSVIETSCMLLKFQVFPYLSAIFIEEILYFVLQQPKLSMLCFRAGLYLNTTGKDIFQPPTSALL